MKKNNNFFASLKSLKKGVGSGVGSGSISLRYRTDPRIRMRIKMSRIPNTDILQGNLCIMSNCDQHSVVEFYADPDTDAIFVICRSGTGFDLKLD